MINGIAGQIYIPYFVNMQKLFFTVCFIYLCVSISAQRKIDVLHYKYEIELSDQSDSIKGKATITIRFLEEIDSFALDIKSQNAYDEKGISALLNNEDTTNMASALHKDDKFNIIPFRTNKKGVEITYVIM